MQALPIKTQTGHSNGMTTVLLTADWPDDRKRRDTPYWRIVQFSHN